MRRETVLPWIGLVLLLSCFTVAALRVARRGEDRPADGRHVLRFAHWQLEGGLREAFDELARDYERLHPDLRVEQLAIPERTYAQWVRTQLIGGTAPDLIQLGGATDEEILARFFLPLGRHVVVPNPYNAGTELAATPWREAFLEGLASGPAYQGNLLEHYGAPISMFTVRMYYNRRLWRLILGDTPAPRTYEELVAVFERVREHNVRVGGRVLAVAGSKANAPMLVDSLVRHQTQRLFVERLAAPALRASAADIGLGLILGDWTLRESAVEDALSLARETALNLQPGFLQLGREDATFHFVQGNALMIATGSWDSPSFRTQVDFELGVFPVPLPGPENPRYGRNAYGPLSEADTGAGLALGVVRDSPDVDRALDFLRFLTSQPANAEFSRRSGWLPAVVGVRPPESIAPFVPEAGGYLPGFDFYMMNLGADSRRLIDTNLNLLYAPSGSVDAFVREISAPLEDAIRSDVVRNARQIELNSARQDIAFLSYTFLARHGESDVVEKADQLIEAQHALETMRAWNIEALAPDSKRSAAPRR